MNRISALMCGVWVRLARWAAICGLSAGAAGAQSVAVYDVQAYLDGVNRLVLAGNTLQWQHFGATPTVGRSGGQNRPTVISSYQEAQPILVKHSWLPDWPEAFPAEVWYDAVSSFFTGLSPSLPSSTVPVSLSVITGRNTVTLLETPTSANGYRIVVGFNDTSPGPSWYRVRVVAGGDMPAGIPMPVSINTDTTWKAIAPEGDREGLRITQVGADFEAANPTWNTDLNFDTSTWGSLVSSSFRWWVPGTHTPMYTRKVFTLDRAMSEAIMEVYADDDAFIYINGVPVIQDDSRSGGDLPPVDVAQHLRIGQNLIAIKAHDSFGIGQVINVAMSGLTVGTTAVTGDLDASWNQTGYTITPVGGGEDSGRGVAWQSDGKVVVAGRVGAVGAGDFGVVRFTTAGGLDATFGSGGKVVTAVGAGDDDVQAVAIQPDGKILVAGSASTGSNRDFAVVRYTSAGVLDPGFGTGGRLTAAVGTGHDDCAGIVVQADGKIVLAGSSWNGTNQEVALIRCTTGGAIDASFGTAGRVVTSIGAGNEKANAIVLQPDGKVVVAGVTAGVGGDEFALVRYLADGTLDGSFGSGGKVTTLIGSLDSECRALALMGDGRLVAGGTYQHASGAGVALVRYLPGGQLDTGFGTGGILTTPIGSEAVVRAVGIRPDGGVVAAGHVDNGSNDDFLVLTYTASGVPDPGFAGTGRAVTPLGSGDDAAYGLSILPDGRFLLAGVAMAGGVGDFATARYLVSTEDEALVASLDAVPLSSRVVSGLGRTITTVLGFAPPAGAELELVRQSGAQPMAGYSNLFQGQAVTLTHGGVDYGFAAHYFGGDGNDLVLRWANHRLMAWGANESGQLGMSAAATQAAVPTPVVATPPLYSKTILSVAAGFGHSLAISADGTLAAWGSNANGQLGIGSTVASASPVSVNQSGVLAGKRVIAVAAGWQHSLALCSDGVLVAWGDGSFGQLGNNGTADSAVPVQVSQVGPLLGKRIIAISAGWTHSVALCSDGTAVSWGDNLNGELGTGSNTRATAPTAVVATGVLAGRTITAVAAGQNHTLALLADGAVAAWGANAHRQLGNNNTLASNVPVIVDANGLLKNRRVSRIAAGGHSSLVLTEDGVMGAWGHNDRGQLGCGSSTTSFGTPQAVVITGVLAGRAIRSLAMGQRHATVLCTDGVVAAWGAGSEGRLGNGVGSDSLVPVPLSTAALGPGDAISLIGSGATASHSFALFGTSTLSAKLQVEHPAGSVLTDGVGSLAFGSTLVGTTRSKTFTIHNRGTRMLGGLQATVVGADPNPTHYAIPLQPPSSLPPGGMATVTVNFTPSTAGAKPVTLRLAHDSAGGDAFDVQLTGSGSASLNVNYTTGTEVAASGNGFSATGKTVTFSLGYVPPTGTTLTVVENTGTGFISGAFGNLAHGDTIYLAYNGVEYPFVANYFGGTGNDLTLHWESTRLLAWGANFNGTLGNNSAVGSGLPVSVVMDGVLSGKTIISVACGSRHTLALCADGTVAAWGANNLGQLGVGHTTSSPVPILVPAQGDLAGRTVVGLAAGMDFSLVLCADGVVVGWGANSSGQLGNGTTTFSAVPIAVDSSGILAGRIVTAIAAGHDFGLAACSDGTVVGWGVNDQGQLGNGSYSGSPVPVAVVPFGALAGRLVIALAGGGDHSLALCADGALVAWGDNGFGTLGDGGVDGSPVPVLVDSTGFFEGQSALSVGAGQSHSMALWSQRMVGLWGDNTAGPGQLGVRGVDFSLSPATVVTTGVMAGRPVVSIAAGRNHSVALLGDGAAVGWGANSSGQLGIGSGQYSEVPALVATSALAAGERMIRLASGPAANHSVAIVARPVSVPGGAPTVTTQAASGVDKVAATLNALVNANGLPSTAFFEYGEDETFGLQTSALNVGGGGASVPFAQSLSGLQPNTVYHYRVVAVNGSGTTYGTALTFSSLPDPPASVTNAATQVANNSATLNGAVNPNGRATTVIFKVSTDSAFPEGNTITTAPQQIAAGNGLVTVAAPVNGLLSGTRYHFRVVAQNAGGRAEESGFQAFTTTAVGIAGAPPTVSGTGVTNITSGSARLQGVVNPNGGITNAFFEYGLAPAFEANSPSLGAGSGSQPQNVLFDAAGLLPGSTYQFRLVAENNFSNGLPGAGLTTGPTVTFTTIFLPPVVLTGSAFPLTTTSVRVDGTVQARNATTQVFFEFGTDGVNFPNSVNATPASVSGPGVSLVSASLVNLQAGVTYHYRLRATNSGGTATGAVEMFVPAVLSGLNQRFPDPPPNATGRLTVTLLPEGIDAGWRLRGERQWRPGGTTISHLVEGDFTVEYRAVPGFIQPAPENISVLSGAGVTVSEGLYFSTAVGGSGSLTVALKPEALASTGIPVADRAQWRLLGDGDAQWRDAGATTTGLLPGSYLVECKPVVGRATPPPAAVAVVEEQTSLITLTYTLPDAPAGVLPTPVGFATVSGESALPHAYVGQIRSDAGLSTGFVVKPRVVATAGHVVWDDGTLAAATGLQWLFQRDKSAFEPEPLIPRGFYIFDGYAAQRAAENSPGNSSPQSQNLDVAALYFAEDAGRGGFSGFLASDLGSNEFLLSSANKLLLGYPVDGISAADQGRLHATAAFNALMIQGFGRCYTTTAMRASGGASGGPLCVQHDNGRYYPAAIYLGGSAQTVVRAIDSAVIDLFNRAEVSGNGGQNNTGGGITHTSVSSNTPGGSLGALKVNIEPAGARAAGAGWRLIPEAVFRPSGSQRSGLNAGTYSLQMKAIPGFEVPSTQTVRIRSAEQATFPFTYVAASVPPPMDAWRLTHFGGTSNIGLAADTADPDLDSLPNLIEFAFGMNPNSPVSGPLQLPQWQRIGDTMVLQFIPPSGISGLTYIAEYSTTLSPDGWIPIPDTGPAPQHTHTLVLSVESPHRFVRIRVTNQ